MLTVRFGIQAAIDGMAFTVFPATQKESPAKVQGQENVDRIDSDGIICKEFVPAGQTVNSAFYEEVLKRLLRRIHRFRPGLHRTGQWMLHDNAPAHCAIRVQFLAQHGVPVLNHPPYSPDLAPAGFFVSPPEEHHEMRTFCRRCGNPICNRFLKRRLLTFSRSFMDVANCVVKDGDYFEGQ